MTVCDSGTEPDSYLKSAGLQKADLVVLREVLESWNSPGKFHHLPNSRGETHGKFLPDFMTGQAWVYDGGGVHRTYLGGQMTND